MLFDSPPPIAAMLPVYGLIGLEHESHACGGAPRVSRFCETLSHPAGQRLVRSQPVPVYICGYPDPHSQKGRIEVDSTKAENIGTRNLLPYQVPDCGFSASARFFELSAIPNHFVQIPLQGASPQWVESGRLSELV